METSPHYAPRAPQDSKAEALIQVVAIEPSARRVNAELIRSVPPTGCTNIGRFSHKRTRVDCVRFRCINHCVGVRRWIWMRGEIAFVLRGWSLRMSYYVTDKGTEL